MGGCWSSGKEGDSPTATGGSVVNLISVNGDLRQYTVPITAAQVLQMENTSTSTISSSFFVCNSDSLYYDEYIPALNFEDELQEGQIYFVLPTTKLQYPLGASDMAALAVKASVALPTKTHRDNRRSNKSRISPVVGVFMEVNNQRLVNSTSSSSSSSSGGVKKRYSDHKQAGLGVSKSVTTRKLQRYSSRRAKMAVRSFRLRLTTIYEGSDLHFY